MRHFSRRHAVACCIVLCACGGDHPTTPLSPEPPPPNFGEFFTNLQLPTYDSSGETVHPDVVTAPSWWPVQARYLVVTPYPNGNPSFENPSLFVGSGVSQWESPAGTPNPLFRPSAGYYSDPDVVFDDATHEMRVYYRSVTDRNDILLTRSTDGVAWTTPVVVASGINHTVVSPSVVQSPAGDWVMWSVNAGESGCSGPSTFVEMRRSLDGITWGDPQPIVLDAPGAAQFPWHLDVEWLPALGEFWMLYDPKDRGKCGTTSLYLATSRDGREWKTYPEPVLVAGELPELKSIVYRSTFTYDAATDALDIWYSGARSSGATTTWKTVGQHVSRTALMLRVQIRSAFLNRVASPSVDLRNPP